MEGIPLCGNLENDETKGTEAARMSHHIQNLERYRFL
jgi:hypothetical protein